MNIHTLEHRISWVLNGSENKEYQRFHSIFRKFISTIIIIDIAAIILSSFAQLNFLDHLLLVISYFSALLFTVEYVLRIYSAPALHKKKFKIKSRLKYITSFYGIIDLISIIPFTLPHFLEKGSSHAEMLEFVSIFMVFKLVKYSKAFNFMIGVFRSVKAELAAGFIIAFVVILFSGMLMYYVEYPAQPDKFYNAGEGFWWAVITFTTVGYGTIYPITTIGKLLASLIALIGIGMIALPTGIISSAFMRKMDEEKKNNVLDKIPLPKEIEVEICPHCGKKIR